MAHAEHLVSKEGFRLRGTSMSRVDGFSDVVFGFALTLLVVSLEVPKTFLELRQILTGFFPFAISFLFLIMLWHAHFRFFRRFGLHDTGTITLNAMLLFVVLFFVYPLKFLFNFQFAEAGAGPVFTSPTDVRYLMTLYGLGYAAVYLLLAALYANAWRQRDELDLNSLERVLTQNWIADALGVASVGLLSVAVAWILPPSHAGFAGFVFMLIGVVKTIHGKVAGRRERKARTQLAHLQAIAHHTPHLYD